MLNLKNRYEEFISGQYRCPSGITGPIFGNKMVRQHQPETYWTIAQLQILPEDTILEIGFGAGFAIAKLVQLAPINNIHGIDLSSTMLQMASRRNASAIRQGRVELRQGDACHLPFADQSFDKIFSIHSCYFWSEPADAIKEIFRVLKPGGVCALTLSIGRITASAEDIFEHHITEQIKQMKTTMRNIGFTSVHQETGPASRQFAIIAIIGTK